MEIGLILIPFAFFSIASMPTRKSTAFGAAQSGCLVGKQQDMIFDFVPDFRVAADCVRWFFGDLFAY